MAKELRINGQILAQQVRLVRDEEQLGIFPVEDALRIADEADLDLVEVAPTADPPVCRILDYGKFKYEQAKRERESRRGSKSVALREVRMRVKIGTHDLDFKVRTARKLLAEGDKVKVSVMFRAREITHPEVGRDLLDRFFGQLDDAATLDRPPSMEGRFMSMILEAAKQRPADAAADADGDGDGDGESEAAAAEAQPVSGGQ